MTIDAASLFIQPARAEDSKDLTKIAFASKRHWNYPEPYYELWKDELTITPEYIANNQVFVATKDGVGAGFLSVVHVSKPFRMGEILIEAGYWLDHLFISPAFIGKGIGSQLLVHVRKICRDQGIAELSIFVDPNAVGFYDKAGAIFVKNVPSSIPGRMLPLYRLPIQ